MSTSIYGYPVVFGTALYGASTDPVDEVVMRDGVANGLLHYADAIAQVRVCASFVGSALTFGDATSAGVEASPTNGQYYMLAGGILGAWPLTQRMSGAGYALRIRVRAKTTNAAGTCTFKVVLSPVGRALEYASAAVDWVWTGSTSSTTIAWLTGTTAGSGAYANRLVVDAPTALGWVQHGIGAPESATVPRSISQCLVALHVFAKTSNNTGVPALYGCYAAEFVGTT